MKQSLVKAILENPEFQNGTQETKAKVIAKFREKGIQMKEILQIAYSSNVLSFNLGYQVMNNTISGSEAALVKQCQIKYDGGWSNIGLSKCTQNAADLIKDYNLFGLQEVHYTYVKLLEDYLRKQNTNFKFVNSRTGLVVGYDSSIYGNAILITPDDYVFGENKNDLRGMMAVYFPSNKTLIINLHAPHYIDLVEQLNMNFEYIGQLFYKRYPYDDPRILVTGDFNDYNGSLIEPSLKGKLKMLGKSLKLHVKGKSDTPKSCCMDSNYKFVGDYIFDSDQNLSYFGFPLGYLRHEPFMSDHDPVVLLKKR